jgi:histidine phosphotransferase ChpT
MAQLADTIRLVELVCARLCHDLGGLIGTVGNALDLLAEDTDRDNEVLAFAATAAKALNQRLRLMRVAWGPEADPITLRAFVDLVTPPLAARRIGLDTRVLEPGCVFPPATGRVLLNLVLLACDCMPHGGTIVIIGGPADLMIRIDGPGAAWPEGLIPCLHDEASALVALTGARSVQMPLTALLALIRNFRLSPVLGTASGIEALRLSSPPIVPVEQPGEK